MPLERRTFSRSGVIAVALAMTTIAGMATEALYPGLTFKTVDYDSLAGLKVAVDKLRVHDSKNIQRKVVLTGSGVRITVEIVVGGDATSGEGWLVAASSMIGVMPKANPILGDRGYAAASLAMFSRGNVFVEVTNSGSTTSREQRPDMGALALQIDAKILEQGTVDAAQLETLRPRVTFEARERKLGKGRVRALLDLTPLPNQSKLTFIGDDHESKHLRIDQRDESELWLRSWPAHPVSGVQLTEAVIHVVNDQLLATTLRIPVSVDTGYDDFPKAAPGPRAPRPERLTREELQVLVDRRNRGELNREQFAKELQRMQREKAARFGITQGPKPPPPADKLTREELQELLDRQENGELTREQVLEEIKRIAQENRARESGRGPRQGLNHQPFRKLGRLGAMPDRS